MAPEGVLLPSFFQDGSRNGCGMMHPPSTCLSLVASFFQLGYAPSKRNSVES